MTAKTAKFAIGHYVKYSPEGWSGGSGIISLVMERKDWGQHWFEYLVDLADGDWVVALEDELTRIG